MWDDIKHLEDLSSHIMRVRSNCFCLAKHFISIDPVLSRKLAAQGMMHDNSKFYGKEAQFLHRGPDVPKLALETTISWHVQTNAHHPEFWLPSQGKIYMYKEFAYEMVCDLLARSQEFGTNLDEYLTQVHFKKYDFSNCTLKHIEEARSILLPRKFQ